MRSRVIAVLLAAAILTAGCAHGSDEPVVAPPLEASSTPPPAYDGSLEPAAAVLAVVPDSATTLTVTDDSQIRLDLGFDDLTGDSPAAERASFASQAAAHSPELTPGLLRPVDEQLEQRFGFSQDDVDWEAHFSGPNGAGWALKMRDDLPVDGITKAVDAGVGPLNGATYYSTTQIVLKGGTIDPTQSWAADASLTALVGQAAAATYVQRSCVPFEVAFGPGLEQQLAPDPAAEVSDLGELDAFSVSFGQALVTVQLGALRDDVFDRSRLADHLPRTDPEFGLGFADPVTADPGGGRIGYALGNPRVAAQLALQQRLPFAVCATP